MGWNKHTKKSNTGKGKLSELVAEVADDDGKRFGNSGGYTHRGLVKDRRYDAALDQIKGWTP